MSEENEKTEETEEIQVIEGWMPYLAKHALATGAKVLMNRYVAPGSGAAVDFALAANDYKNDNKVSCAVNILSGFSEISTCGISSGVKNAVRGRAQKAVVGSKEVTSCVKMEKKKLGEELGKRLATGKIAASEKPAAIQRTQERAKTASKEIKNQALKTYKREIDMSTEEAMFQGGRLKAENSQEFVAMQLISNRFRLDKDLVQSSFESASAKIAEDVFTEFTKPSCENINPTILDAATKAGKEEFKEHDWKFFVKDVGFAGLQGVIKNHERENPDPKFQPSFPQEHTSFSFSNSSFSQTPNIGREDQQENTSFSFSNSPFSQTPNIGREHQQEYTSLSFSYSPFCQTPNIGRDQQENTSFPFSNLPAFSRTLDVGREDQQENTSFSFSNSPFSRTLNIGREDKQENTSFSFSNLPAFSRTLNMGREDKQENTLFPFSNLPAFSRTLNIGREDKQENT